MNEIETKVHTLISGPPEANAQGYQDVVSLSTVKVQLFANRDRCNQEKNRLPVDYVWVMDHGATIDHAEPDADPLPVTIPRRSPHSTCIDSWWVTDGIITFQFHRDHGAKKASGAEYGYLLPHLDYLVTLLDRTSSVGSFYSRVVKGQWSRRDVLPPVGEEG